MSLKVIHATGQMCNQFWIISNYISDALELGDNVGIWAPDFDITKFPELCEADFIKFPFFVKKIIKRYGFSSYKKYVFPLLVNRIVIRGMQFFFSILPKASFYIKDISYMESKNRHKNINRLKEIFTPYPEDKTVRDVFEYKRQSCDNIVGIHIRYGDYRLFKDGKYFYSLLQYRRMMENMISLLGEDVKTTFFICSNENLNLDAFDGLSYFTLQDANPFSDLMGLSFCDYIIGPPSSYSAWASLYNHIPLLIVEDAEFQFSNENFIHIEERWFAR